MKLVSNPQTQNATLQLEATAAEVPHANPNHQTGVMQSYILLVASASRLRPCQALAVADP